MIIDNEFLEADDFSAYTVSKKLEKMKNYVVTHAVQGPKGEKGEKGEKGDKGDDGIPEAPIDGKVYGLKDGAWADINSLIDNSIQEAIEDVLLGGV